MTGYLIEGTNLKLPGQMAVHKGKVRDVYDLGDKLLMVSTDRYSAFDRNLAVVPNKGELLTAITKWWFENTEHIVKNHVINYPDPNAILCKKYKVLPLEMIVRGYITGVTNTSLWHTYLEGKRDYGEFTLPDGLNKNDRLPEPVVTPTTKFEEHDRNLTPEEAVKEGLVDKQVFEKAKQIALDLFKFGQETAYDKRLILVDTKYEFGLSEDNEIVLIDEIHTPDSSRYWLKDSYGERIKAGKEPENYDKEFLRLWFKERFDPYENREAPKAPAEVVRELSRRYAYVYEQLTGSKFTPSEGDPLIRIKENVLKYLKEADGQA